MRREDAVGQRPRRAGVQPLASRGRERCRRRLGPRPPGAAQRRTRRQGDAGAHPRRLGFRRAGRDPGNAADVAGPCVLHGRHAPPHHQQPGGFHHARPARHAFHAVLQRRGEDDRGADPARERRRPRGGRLRRALRRRLPHEVPQGRRDRPRLLPPARPQRGRRARGDAAGNVRNDPQEADHASAVCGKADRRRRDHSWLMRTRS